MKILAGLAAALAVLAMIPPQAHAQRRGRGGTVNTPYGQFQTGELQAAGGDPFAAGEFRQQRMMMLYQQQMLKQQQKQIQQMAKKQQASKDGSKKASDAPKAVASTTKSASPKSKVATAAKAKAKSTTSSPAASDVPGAPK